MNAECALMMVYGTLWQFVWIWAVTVIYEGTILEAKILLEALAYMIILYKGNCLRGAQVFCWSYT